MSRMRLMEVAGNGVGTLVSVCLHCGAERASAPPYDVMHCYCRSDEEERRPAPRARRQARRIARQAA